jgi:hypothetical protein
MVWAVLLVLAVGTLIVFTIAKEEGGQAASIAPNPSDAWRTAKSLGKRFIEWYQRVADRRTEARTSRSFAERFSAEDDVRVRGTERIKWRDRVIALMELILLVVFLSALFATALAAAALKIGHFHS